MSSTSADTTQRHVDMTMSYLEHQVSLRALIALTEGHAQPGEQAMQLILPILGRFVAPDWRYLAGIPPGIVMQLARQALAALMGAPRWEAPALAAALSEVIAPEACPEDLATLVIKVLVLGYDAPFPLAAALQAVGRDACLGRLRLSRDRFAAAQRVQ